MLVQKRLYLLLLMLTNCWLCLTSQLDPFHSIALIASSTQISLVPRPFVGEMAWQLTRVQTIYGYDVKEITAQPVQATNIG